MKKIFLLTNIYTYLHRRLSDCVAHGERATLGMLGYDLFPLKSAYSKSVNKDV